MNRTEKNCHDINLTLYIRPDELKKIQHNAMQTSMTWDTYLEHTIYKAIERMITLPKLTKVADSG